MRQYTISLIEIEHYNIRMWIRPTHYISYSLWAWTWSFIKV